MKVPNEILPDILHPLDYSSLLRLKFTASRFYHVVEHNQRQLPKRQELILGAWPTVISLMDYDVVVFRDGYSSPSSLELALTSAAAVAALHPVVSVKTRCEAIETGLADTILRHFPSSVYAQDVQLIGLTAVTKAQIEIFVGRFPRLESLTLDEIPADFDWTILRSDGMLRLPGVCISPKTSLIGAHLTETIVEEIVRFCCDFTKLGREETKFMELRQTWEFSQAFVDRVIQVTETAPRHITVYVKVELLNITHEEKEVPTFGHVLIPVLDLDEDRFEQRPVDVNPAFTESPRWADVGYYSRHSQSAVFVVCHEPDHPNLPLMATVVMTNDPIQKEVYVA